MSDIYLVLTDKNEPVIAFATQDDANQYVAQATHGSILLAPRTDLRVLPLGLWRSMDKFVDAIRKVDPSYGKGRTV